MIHYDPETKTLEVKFRTGDTVYHYHNVSHHMYNAFENAKSYGEFFTKHIRDKYKTSKKKHVKPKKV